MDKWQKNLVQYDEVVASIPAFERKGKTVPYTSANGHMFSFINKDGDLGIRIGKESAASFVAKYQTQPFKSHGALMKGYVLIPDQVLENTSLLKDLLEEGHRYVLSLKPK